MAAPRVKTTGIGLVELANRVATPPLAARLRIALDVLEPLAEGRPVRVVSRKKGSRFDVANVQIAVRGRAKLSGRGNRSGVAVLLWEVLACRSATGRSLPPLSAVVSDMEPEIESVVERALRGDAALKDAGELVKSLVIASAGQVGQHRELAKLVASASLQASPRESTDTIRSPVSFSTPPFSVAAGRANAANESGLDDELDKAVSEVLVNGIGEGWENLLERTRSAPPERREGFAIADPDTIDGDELIEDIVDEPTLEEGKSPPIAKASIRTPPPVPKRTPPPLPRQPLHPARPDVLLIEPDAPTAAHIAGLLRRAGFAVELCADPDDAVLKAVATQPRCIVCDEDTVGMSGTLVAERTRTASPRASLAPFVFVGNAKARRKSSGRASSRDVWLKKPFATDDLLDHVRRLTGEHGETPSQRPPSIAPPVGQIAIDGDLALFSLRTVLAMLEIDRQSGVLVVHSEDREARLTLHKGAVTQATVVGRKKRPADALAIVTTWDAGRFSFQMASETPADRWVSSELQPRTTG